MSFFTFHVKIVKFILHFKIVFDVKIAFPLHIEILYFARLSSARRNTLYFAREKSLTTWRLAQSVLRCSLIHQIGCRSKLLRKCHRVQKRPPETQTTVAAPAENVFVMHHQCSLSQHHYYHGCTARTSVS